VLPPLQNASTVYQNNFETPVVGNFKPGVTGEWQTYRRSTTPGTAAHAADNFLGDFSNQNVRLSLSALPEHGLVTVQFDVYVIRSWDGNHGSPYGPDVWQLSADGQVIDSATFRNVPGAFQSYPDVVGQGAFAPGSGAYQVNSLGYNFTYPAGTPLSGTLPADSVYRLSYTFEHTGPNVNLDFSASGLQPIADESWGLDNVKIDVNPAPVLSDAGPFAVPLVQAGRLTTVGFTLTSIKRLLCTFLGP
jgi:hypothetical protein